MFSTKSFIFAGIATSIAIFENRSALKEVSQGG